MIYDSYIIIIDHYYFFKNELLKARSASLLYNLSRNSKISIQKLLFYVHLELLVT